MNIKNNFIKQNIKMDLCTSCGRFLKSKNGGDICECGSYSVHQIPCDLCGEICGVLIDDDFCGTSVLMCPQCMDSAYKNNKKINERDFEHDNKHTV